MEKVNGIFTCGSWLLCSRSVSLSCQSANKWDHFIRTVDLWSSSRISWAGEMTANQFSVHLFVQPAIQTLTNPSVPKSDMRYETCDVTAFISLSGGYVDDISGIIYDNYALVIYCIKLKPGANTLWSCDYVPKSSLLV